MRKMLFAMALCLGVGLLVVFPTTRVQSDVMRAHFINVGRGDATLLEFPCGAIVVDTGGNRRALISYLAQFFAGRPDLQNRLSLVVLTHGHPDHVENINAVLDRFDVTTLVENGRKATRPSRTLDGIYRAHSQTKIRIANADTIPRGGRFDPDVDQLDCAQTDPDIRVLWGQVAPGRTGWSQNEFAKENNHSVSVVVTWGQSRILLTGDLHVVGLEDLIKTHGPLVKNVSLYHASHHGFKNATSRKTLKQISPEIAILSRPADRAWHRRTKRIYDEFTRSKRPSVNIPVWKYKDDKTNPPKWRKDPNSYERDVRTGPRMITTESLSAGVYWTGRDGHVVVDVHTNGKMSVAFLR